MGIMNTNSRVHIITLTVEQDESMNKTVSCKYPIYSRDIFKTNVAIAINDAKRYCLDSIKNHIDIPDVIEFVVVEKMKNT